MTVSFADYQGMDGGAWQRLCMQVLHQEHGDDIVPVPDKVDGDAGIEAYTLTGHVYQCYSPEEPLSSEQRYISHRRKMTDDIGKFIDNGSKLAPMFGSVRIRRWILLIPVADNRKLNAHATKQTQRVLAERLPYVDSDFFVLAHTLDHYRASHDSVINARLQNLFLPLLNAPDYSAVNTELVGNMRRKLSKIPRLRNVERRSRYERGLLDAHIGGMEYREYIRDHYSDLDEELEHLLLDLEERLDSEFALMDDPPEKMLLRVKHDAEERVRRAIPTVREGHSRVIAHGQVAEWLMRCPLDFDEAS